MNSIMVSTNLTPILDFYRNSTIFITGGTGFVGKILIQKLLSTFDLKKIYMLIRNKDNMNINQRLETFFNEPIFNKIRKTNPELFKKVHPIYADFNAMDLAISNEDHKMIIENVEIVFNVVASVKFNEKLGHAISINILGTKKVLDLVMKMKCLKTFVHISTLYCNCNRKFINEQVYEHEIGYEKIVQVQRILDETTFENLQHCLIGSSPNTYTMTKKCAEHLVNHKAYFLPAGIFRLPIVLSTYKEPFPGYTDNVYGPTGLCTWTARGFVRCIWGNSKRKANMIPADYCVNALIASAWDIAERFKIRKCESTEIPVYNYIFDVNNITWGQFMHLARMGFHEPFDKSLWYYTYVIISSRTMHRIIRFMLHNIPGYILDIIALVTGQKRIYTKAYKKINRVIDIMSYFGLAEWRFSNNNIIELDRRLIGGDRKLLEFHVGTIDWNDYFKHYLSGIRRYFFKETDENLEKRKIFYKRLYMLHILLKTTFGFSFLIMMLKLHCKIFKYFPKITLNI